MKRLKQFIALAVCYCLLIQPVPVFATGGSESHNGPGNVTTGNCGVNSMGVKISFSKTSIEKDSFTGTSLYQRGVEPYILDADKLADTSCKDIYAKLNAGMNDDQKNQWQCNNSIGIIVCRGDKNGYRGAVATEGTILQGKQDKAVYGGVIEGHGAAALTKDDAIAAVKRVVSLCESESGGKFGKDLLWGQKGEDIEKSQNPTCADFWKKQNKKSMSEILEKNGYSKDLAKRYLTGLVADENYWDSFDKYFQYVYGAKHSPVDGYTEIKGERISYANAYQCLIMDMGFHIFTLLPDEIKSDFMANFNFFMQAASKQLEIDEDMTDAQIKEKTKKQMGNLEPYTLSIEPAQKIIDTKGTSWRTTIQMISQSFGGGMTSWNFVSDDQKLKKDGKSFSSNLSSGIFNAMVAINNAYTNKFKFPYSEKGLRIAWNHGFWKAANAVSGKLTGWGDATYNQSHNMDMVHYGANSGGGRYGYAIIPYALPAIVADPLEDFSLPGAKAATMTVKVTPEKDEVDVSGDLKKDKDKVGHWQKWKFNVKIKHTYKVNKKLQDFSKLLASASKTKSQKYYLRITVLQRSNTRKDTVATKDEDMLLECDNKKKPADKKRYLYLTYKNKPQKFLNNKWTEVTKDFVNQLASEKGLTGMISHSYFSNITSIMDPEVKTSDSTAKTVDEMGREETVTTTTYTQTGTRRIEKITPVQNLKPEVIVTLAVSDCNTKHDVIPEGGTPYYRVVSGNKSIAKFVQSEWDSEKNKWVKQTVKTPYVAWGLKYPLWVKYYDESKTSHGFTEEYVKKWFKLPSGFKENENFYLCAADSSAITFKLGEEPISEDRIEKEVQTNTDFELPEFTSTLTQPYAEMKEGDIYNEEFEAMAGTPTTRQLYFASGGKEYLVQLKSKVCFTKNTERTYTQNFTDVQCSAHIDPKYESHQASGKDAPDFGYDTATDSKGYTVKVKWEAVNEGECTGHDETVGKSTHHVTDTYWWGKRHNGHECNNSVSVSWKQPFENLTYVQILGCKVWQLQKSKVSGMIDLVDADDINATVISNQGKALFNAAASDTSKDGRMYYGTTGPETPGGVASTIDHHVKSEECRVDTCIENPKHLQYQIDEWESDMEATKVLGTVISDYLILETSMGDQSIQYFEYDADEPVSIGKRTGPTTIEGEPVKQTFKTFSEEDVTDMVMHTYEPLTPDCITYGGYTGDYENLTGKYESYSTLGQNIELDSLTIRKDDCETKRDNTNVDKIFRLQKTFMPNARASNREYITENSRVFYSLVVDYKDPENEPAYDVMENDEFGGKGMEVKSIYRKDTDDCNDIVIHDPVSVQYAHIVSLPEDRDQRTTKTPIEQEVHTQKTYVENCTYSGSRVHGDECYEIEIEHVPKEPEGGGSTAETVGEATETSASGHTTYSDRKGGNVLVIEPYESGTVTFYSDGYDADPWGHVYEGDESNEIHSDDDGGNSHGKSKFDFYISFTAEAGKTYIFGVGAYSSGGACDWVCTYPRSNAYIYDNSPYADAEQDESGPAIAAQQILVCEEPHHADSSAWYRYTVGMNHVDGSVCMGKDCVSCNAGVALSFYDGTTKTIEQIKASGVLIKHDGNIHLSYGDTSYCHTCGRNVEPSDTTEVTDVDKPFGEAGHYDFGNPTCYEEREITLGETNTDARTTPGDFIQLDYEFQIYYPNIGDFYGNGALGIADTSGIEGYGYTSPMDTSEWTGIKGVTFDFDVIYDDKAYPAGTYINLYNRWNNTGYLHGKKGDDYYDFYVPLCNNERTAATCDFVTIATNNYSDVWSENYDVLNYARYEPDKSAKHDAFKTAQTQIIGRIGGLTLEDTGDWRFSNLFKQAKKPTDWLVNGTVKKVDSSKAKHLLADFIDIRGNNVEHNGKVSIREHIMDALGLNTYGAEPYKNNTTYKIIDLPLTPSKNNIKALRKQALRIGYKMFMDVETIGCYFGLNQGEGQFLQITPVYYYFDSQSGQLFPVDIYMKNNNEYVPINLYGNDRNDNVTPYRMIVNWQEEDTRRNVTNEENKESQDIIKSLTDAERVWTAASGTRANIGTAQRLYLDESVRTFVGSPFTNGLDNNPGNILAMKEAVDSNTSTYHFHGQKWHFTLGLPSSAVWVKHGEECTDENIQKYRKKKSYLICALDILAIGEIWTLRYRNTNLSQVTIVGGQKPFDPKKITVPDPDPTKPDIPIPVVAVYDTTHSSRDDIDTVGTH